MPPSDWCGVPSTTAVTSWTLVFFSIPWRFSYLVTTTFIQRPLKALHSFLLQQQNASPFTVILTKRIVQVIYNTFETVFYRVSNNKKRVQPTIDSIKPENGCSANWHDFLCLVMVEKWVHSHVIGSNIVNQILNIENINKHIKRTQDLKHLNLL